LNCGLSVARTMPSKKKSSGSVEFKFEKDEKVLVLPTNSQEDICEAKVLGCEKRGKSKKMQYFIHYKGWNSRWDEWVDHGRLLKINEGNLQIMNEQNKQKKAASQQPASRKKRKPQNSPPSTSPKRRRLNDEARKRGAKNKASLDIKLPSSLKRKLIGDWERITKKRLVMELPRAQGTRICDILSDFQADAVREGQDQNIVAEIARGIKDYFNQALRVTLLYKLERRQLAALCKEYGELSMDQMYGVEHLCRLFVKLPRLLSPDDLDKDTRDILKMQIEFIMRFVLRRDHYWNAEYIPAAHESP